MIDFSTHIFPPDLLRAVDEHPSPRWASLAGSPIGGSVRLCPPLGDLDVRIDAIERLDLPGYRQVLVLGSPPLELCGDPTVSLRLSAIANEGLAALVERYPQYFAAALGTAPVDRASNGHRELDHIQQLGLPGVQLYTSVGGVPLDSPSSLAVLEDALSRGLVVFLHPARTGEIPDFAREAESRFNLWQILGWPHETAVTMVRLAGGGIFDRHPTARIVTHHLGGMVPYFADRIALNAATYRFGNPLQPAKEEFEVIDGIVEHLRRFHGDTALQGGPAALTCGVEFFGPDRVVFGSDTPYDSDGTTFVERAIDGLAAADLSDGAREAILDRNASLLLNL